MQIARNTVKDIFCLPPARRIVTAFCRQIEDTDEGYRKSLTLHQEGVRKAASAERTIRSIENEEKIRTLAKGAGTRHPAAPPTRPGGAGEGRRARRLALRCRW